MKITDYNEKVLRKAIRGIVKEYVQSMSGRYRCTDFSGDKWEIEYNLMVWREDWNDWDLYNGDYTQKDLFYNILRYCFSEKNEGKTFAVEIALTAGGRTNRSKIFNLSGTEYVKED